MVVLRSGCAFGGDFYARQGKVATTGSSRATAVFLLIAIFTCQHAAQPGGSCTWTLLAAGLAFFPLLARFDEDLCGGRKRTDSCSSEALAAQHTAHQSDICSNEEGVLYRGRGRGAWVASHRHDKANNITCELASCLVPHRVAEWPTCVHSSIRPHATQPSRYLPCECITDPTHQPALRQPNHTNRRPRSWIIPYKKRISWSVCQCTERTCITWLYCMTSRTFHPVPSRHDTFCRFSLASRQRAAQVHETFSKTQVNPFQA